MLVCTVLAGGLIGAARAAEAAPATYVVTIEGMQFNPPTLTVRPGDRVVWTNKDLVPHTASANSLAFDSRSIAPNTSWTYVPGKSGRYPYRCSFHPAMQGVLIVR